MTCSLLVSEVSSVESSSLSSEATPLGTTRLILDPGVPDYADLMAAVLPGTEVYLLNSQVDGVTQITAYLQKHPADSIHIVSHGAPGALHLGHGELNLDNLGHYAPALATWFAQSQSPSLFLYGCNVAAGDAGAEFIEKLHRFTGATIAASTRPMGNGTWNLNTWAKVRAHRSAPQRIPLPQRVPLDPAVLATYPHTLLNQAPTQLQLGWQQIARPTAWVGGQQINGQQVSNSSAFAALKSNGSVVTWGYGEHGGDSSSVAGQLSSGVKAIFSAGSAFAALKTDGSVVTWGNGMYGGDSSNVASQLSSGVEAISSNANAFAALKTDGSVVTWGSSVNGGDSSSVASQLSSGVAAVFSTGTAFAALKTDGSVVTWGSSSTGGNSSLVSSQLSSDVVSIFSNSNAFAALKADGSVVTWGYGDSGGDSSSVASQLSSGVETIFSNGQAFAALKTDGSVVTWGAGWAGGNSSLVSGQLAGNVQSIVANEGAFAALKTDGSVVTWGRSGTGGDSSGVASQLSSGVKAIVASGNAFVALKADGSVVTWGDPNYGGNSSSVASQLASGVERIFSTGYAFAAVKLDGSVVTWGNGMNGGDSASVAGQLSSGVKTIFSTGFAFAALKLDGSVITWGSSDSGGDSSGVASQLSSDVVGLAHLPRNSFTETTHLDENLPFNTLLGRFFTTDPDTGDTFTYSLVAGEGDADNAAFRIEGNQLLVQTSPNYETHPNGYSIRVRTTDQAGDFYERIIVLGVSDLQEAPTSTNASVTLNEDTAYGFSVSHFPYSDEDGNAFSALKITSLPGAGQLFLDANGNGIQDEGEAVTSNQVIVVDDLNQLTFLAAPNANGNGYAAFGYQVGDTFGFSTNTYTMTLNVANVDDAPTGSVTLSGSAIQGETLTVTNDLEDIDGIPGPIIYQWQADGVNIVGATGTTYTLTQADVGKVMTVVASYTDGFGNEESVTSAATSAVANVNDAPRGTVTISGGAQQNATLTASDTIADEDGIPGAITYTWYADGSSTGVIGTSYTLTQADVGKAFTVVATYTDGFGKAESVTSAATRAVVNINDAPTGVVRITGTATQGQTLTASHTLADRDGLGPIAYQWRANGLAISGATNSTFTLGQGQVGKAITVTARYTDGFGKAESVTSAATRAVVNINDAPTGVVRITGTATQGQTLTASHTLADRDGLGPIAYQWRANGLAITGATRNIFTLTQAQVGKAITVTARYTDGFGKAESVTSAATRAVVNINDAPTGVVRITGTATQGQTLTASHTLADRDGLGPITYQWRANGLAITGATRNIFTLTQAQVGKAITVTARYTDGFGKAESVTSAATRAVSPAPTTAMLSATTVLASPADSLAPTLAIPGEMLDLRSLNRPTATLTFQVTQDSALGTTVGFYTVTDTQGRVRDPLTGTLIQPGEAGYQQAALANRVVDNLVGQNGRTLTYTATVGTDQPLSTFLVVGGPLSALLDTNPGNDPTVFFSPVAANGDRQDHVRLLGQNTFGFEDTWGGGDRDFNDVTVRTTVA